MGFLPVHAIAPASMSTRVRTPSPTSHRVAKNDPPPTDRGQSTATTMATATVKCPNASLDRRHQWGFRWQKTVATEVTEMDIYYGTVTGTALRLATRLADQVAARGLRVQVHDLDDFDPRALAAEERRTSTRIFVFVVATHFAGTPPPSAERFHVWLQDQSAGRTEDQPLLDVEATTGPRPPPLWGLYQWLLRRRIGESASSRRLLRNMQYAVFGVGDSSFLTFNAMGRFVDATLRELGATQFFNLGLGDASKDINDMFDNWTGQLLRRLPNRRQSGDQSSLSKPSPSKITPVIKPALSKRARMDDLYALSQPRFQCVLLGAAAKTHRKRRVSMQAPADGMSSGINRQRGSVTSLLPQSSSRQPSQPRVRYDFPFIDLMTINCPSGGSEGRTTVAFLRMRLIDPQMTFAAGDTLALFPHNLPEHVSLIAGHFGFDLDAWIDVSFAPSHSRAAHERLPFPTPCTVRTALTEYVELRTISREFVQVAAGFASDPAERHTLERLGSSDGAVAFQELFQNGHKGIPELLALAPSLKIPLEIFINISHGLRPRFFTIASSPRVHPTDLDLAITLGRPREGCGLAVGFFRRLLLDGHSAFVSMRGFISPSHFSIPKDPTAPMIMIANGVGIGPMRALLQDREYERALMGAAAMCHGDKQPPMTVTNLVLVGCTDPESLVFGTDLWQWYARGHIHLDVAYSAIETPTTPAMHVQDLVLRHLNMIVALLETHPTGRLYISGRAAMAADVRRLLLRDQNQRGIDWFDRLQDRGGYVEAGHG